MGTIDRDVNLRIRAQLQGGPDLKATAAAIEDISSSLDSQVAAARRGELSLSELSDSVKLLGGAMKSIAANNGLIELLGNMNGQLGGSLDKLHAAGAALYDLQTKIKESGTATAAQTKQLAALQKAYDGASNQVRTLQAGITRANGALQTAGIDTENLAAAQMHLAEMQTEAAQSAKVLSTAMTGYQANLRTTRSEAKATAEALAAVAKAASYTKTADQLNASVKANTALSSAGPRTNAPTNVAGLQSITNPAAAQRSTLGGVEEQVNGIAKYADTLVGLGKPVRDYEATLKQLGDTQAALSKQGGLVDAFRAQMTAVNAARSAFVAARTDVQNYANALREAPSDELVVQANQAKTALAGASRELDSQVQKARTLRAGLLDAGIATNKLSAEEVRLATSSAEATRAAAVVSDAYEKFGKAQPQGQGLFGLRPYQLENLGYQVNDVITQLASGTKVTQVIAQQGGQIFQIFETNLTKMISSAIRFAPAIALGAVAIAGIIRAVSNQTALREFNTLLNSTTSGADYQAAALVKSQRQLADYGNSFADAGKAVQTFIQAGVSAGSIDTFGKMASDLARIKGIDLPTAAQQVTTAFTGTYDAIAKLDDQYNFLTTAQRDQIRTLEDSGQSLEAGKIAMAAFEAETDKAAANARGPWMAAFHSLGQTYTEMLDYFSNTAPIQAVVAVMNGLAYATRYASDGLGSFFKSLAMPGSDSYVPKLQAQIAELTKARDAMGTPKGPIGQSEYAEIQKQIDLDTAALAKFQDQAKKGNGTGAPGSQPGSAPGPVSVPIQKATSDFLDSQDKQLQQREGELDAAAKIAAVKQQTTDAFNKAVPAATDQASETVRQAALTKAVAAAEKEVTDELARQNKLRLDGLSTNKSQSDATRLQAAADKATEEGRKTSADPNIIAAAGALGRQKEQAAIDREHQSAANKLLSQERELQNQLAAVDARGDAAQKTNLDARLAGIDEKYKALYANLNKYAASGGTTISGKSIDQTRSDVEAAEQTEKNQATLDVYVAQVADLTKERDSLIKDIEARVASGSVSTLQGVQQVGAVVAKLAPDMQKAAQAGLAFAASLKGGATDAQTRAAVAALQKGNTSADSTGKGSPIAAGTDAVLKAGQTDIDSTIKQRTELIAAANAEQAAGAITVTQAQAQIKAAYDATTSSIDKQIDDQEKALKAAMDASTSPAEKNNYQAQINGLQAMRAQAQYVDPLMASIDKSIETSFSSSAVSGFDGIAKSLAGLVDGTSKWRDVLGSVESAVGTLFSSLLKSIGEAIIKFYALQLASDIVGTNVGGGGGGGGSGGSGGAGAAGGLAAGGGLLARLFGSGASAGVDTGAFDSGVDSEGVDTGLFDSGVADEGADVAASSGGFFSSIGDFFSSLFHDGGVIGSVKDRTKQVSPSWFEHAPRFHGGGLPGLAPDEVPIVAQKGEEMLSKSDPRNVLNGGKMGGQSSAPQSIKQVLVMDPSDIQGAMANDGGAHVVLTHIKQNKQTVKQLLS